MKLLVLFLRHKWASLTGNIPLAQQTKVKIMALIFDTLNANADAVVAFVANLNAELASATTSDPANQAQIDSIAAKLAGILPAPAPEPAPEPAPVEGA